MRNPGRFAHSAIDSGAKAGVIFRETTTAGAKNAITYMGAGGAVFCQNKTSTNGGASNTSTTGRGFPEWIRLVRNGNSFTGFYSHDGITWMQQGPATTNTMTNGALIGGLAVAPRTGGQTANVIFDNVTFHPPLDAWRLAALGTDANTGSTADSADFDNDGTANLLEYALGTTPTSAASVARIIPQVSGFSLQVSFLRARSDLTYIVEGSSDLSPNSWQTVATNPGQVGQIITVTDPNPANPSRFLRLKVTP